MTLRSTLPLFLALTAAGCGPVDISDGEDSDCNECNADSDSDSDTDTDADADADADSDADTDTDGDLVLYVGTPGSGVVATMFVNVEFLTDLDAEFGTWGWSGRYAWTSGVTLGFDPGLIEGARWNATYCTTDTEDESHSSCNNWLAYGQNSSEAHLTASTGITYFDASYDVDLVSFCWDDDGNGTEESCGSSAYAEFED